MLIIGIYKDDLKKAYQGKPYDCSVLEEEQKSSAVDCDLLLLRILLENYPLTGRGSAA